MGWFYEERALVFLWVLGYDACPGQEGLERLLDLLAGLLIVQQARLNRARLWRIPDGRGLIGLPLRLQHHEITWLSIHEAAHVLQGHGMAELLRSVGQDRMAAAVEDLEEEEVEAFLLAFLLPAHVVYQVKRDTDLAELSGCSLEVVQRRRKASIPRHHLKLPCSWCAREHFKLTHCPAPQNPVLLVEERETGAQFWLPAPPDDVDGLVWQLNTELMAFTPDEFRAKYQGFAVPPASSVLFSVEQFNAHRARLVGGAA